MDLKFNDGYRDQNDVIEKRLKSAEKEECEKSTRQDSPDSRFGTLRPNESWDPEDRTLRNHLKIPQEVNNRICEAVNCFSPAEVEIKVKVGQLGKIPLLLCSSCVGKF